MMMMILLSGLFLLIPNVNGFQHLSSVTRTTAHVFYSTNNPTTPSSPSASAFTVQETTRVVRIALTRELGNNDKLQTAIESQFLSTQHSQVKLILREMPCIQHAPGDDVECFQKLLAQTDTLQRTCDYIVITSPESAHVFYESMNNEPHRLPSTVRVAAVGKATEKQLTQLGFQVHFVPSQADGETLARELPPISSGVATRVLYPASAKAADTIQQGLEQKRPDAVFRVTRLNTYDTVAATLDAHALQEFTTDSLSHIACFGSPSAVEAWLDNVDSLQQKQQKGNGNVLAVCIGATTATACRNSQRWKEDEIFYPKKNPGVEGWAQACVSAIQYLLQT